ncbi:amino acid deaminase/aldolase [Nocardioides albertanoniae]|uniref:amino acid deaminase/aldolase n=1 Tax=Nocardioides albertanoniae TaxID=1175486 RepID=UPI00114E5595|nr:amino acid deaminase/aldolase [Nocardioides albertanoniae]
MVTTSHHLSAQQHDRLDRATAGLDGPVGAVDLAAFDANADDLVRRAAGTPIRVASKSVRCRALLDRVLAREGYEGILAFTLSEALWLAETHYDIVIGYPTAERAALAALAGDEEKLARITLMVDSAEGLSLLKSAIGTPAAPVRVALDLDAALVIARRIWLGPRRSPVRTPEDAVALARLVTEDPDFELVGLMAYEGQVAGLVDRPLGGNPPAPVIRRMKRASVAEITERRGKVVAAVRSLADLEFVNGGGTGSIESTRADPSVTEIAAGSGLYGPTLFDRYDGFTPHPAAYFGLSVVRRPAPGIVTVAGGGWIASGPVGPDRAPSPTYPFGLDYVGTEGAGEVQTPLRGAAADTLAIGDKVWFRHAKAGEVCERLDSLHLVENDAIITVAPTYRGEGKTFM